MLEAAGSIAIIVVAGFLCWLIVQAGLYLQNQPTVGRPRPMKVQPISAHEFKSQVDANQARPCRECGTPYVGPKCTNCGHTTPTTLRTARTSFSTIKRRLEDAN